MKISIKEFRKLVLEALNDGDEATWMMVTDREDDSGDDKKTTEAQMTEYGQFGHEVVPHGYDPHCRCINCREYEENLFLRISGEEKELQRMKALRNTGKKKSSVHETEEEQTNERSLKRQANRKQQAKSFVKGTKTFKQKVTKARRAGMENPEGFAAWAQHKATGKWPSED